MKIRNGFVSNSSSTSFVLGVKGKIDYDTVLKLLKIPEDSPLYSIAKGVANFFVYDLEETTLDDFLDWFGCSDVSELPEGLRKMAENGMTIYTGSVASDGDDIERLIFLTPFDYNTDELVVYKVEF